MTIPKMKTQIAVVSQKTKSIPPRSSDASSGSQGMKKAIANATAHAARPTTTMEIAAPLRNPRASLAHRPPR